MAKFTPQTEKRIAWEDAMYHAMTSGEFGVTRSDAQSIAEVKPALVDEMFASDMSPADAAKKLLG